MSRRLRTTKLKPGKALTEVGTRCGGGLATAWISAATLVSFDAAAGARVELGDCGAAGRVFKGQSRAEEG